MCDPVTILAVTSAVSTVASGYQAKQQGKFQEGVSRFNARQMENEATRTRNVSVEEENEQRRATAELISKQRAQAAASGVEIESGSAGLLLADTETLGEIDARRIRSNFEDQALSLEKQAEIELATGRAARRAGEAAFTTSLITTGIGLGAGAVASGWFTAESAAASALGTGVGGATIGTGAATIGSGVGEGIRAGAAKAATFFP